MNPPDPHAYLPQRIVNGSMKPEGFEVIIAEKAQLIPWNNIQLVCLGLVEDPVLETPKNFYNQIRDTLKNFFSKEKNQAETPLVRQIYYLELFAAGQDLPLRMESTSINYRSFIQEADYISENNFKKFLSLLTAKLPDCVFTESIYAILKNQKSDIKKFGNIYEFQRDCQERWLKQQSKGS
jgi:hypothetical protein